MAIVFMRRSCTAVVHNFSVSAVKRLLGIPGRQALTKSNAAASVQPGWPENLWKPRQSKKAVHWSSAEYESGCPLAYGGAVLEAMPRTSAHQPDVFRRGVPVDHEVVIRAVLVLTHTGFK
jgi:hypothetical protein